MAKKAKKILIDANAFVSLNWQEDNNHQKAKTIFEKLKQEGWLLWSNNYLVSEVLTVLLQKLKNVKSVARLGQQLYSSSRYIKVRQVSKKLQLKSLGIFSSQKKPKLSFPDCTLIAQAKEQKIKTIFTFDKNIRSFPLLKRGYRFVP